MYSSSNNTRTTRRSSRLLQQGGAKTSLDKSCGASHSHHTHASVENPLSGRKRKNAAAKKIQKELKAYVKRKLELEALKPAKKGKGGKGKKKK